MGLPINDVAKLIMDLMARGRSGGLPMNASPELTQYLAHAQGGTAPPQQRMNPRADVLQGPGSGARAIREPEFENFDPIIPTDAGNGWPAGTSSWAEPPDNVTPLNSRTREFYNRSTEDIQAETSSLMDENARLRAELESLAGERGLDPMDLVTDDLNRPGRLPNQTFRQESYGDFQGEPLFIWAKDKNGKMIKIDGPFENDIEAARELKMLRSSGLTQEVEIRPDWPINPV